MSRKAKHGGRRAGAGRKPWPDDAKAALARLELLTGMSREEILIAGVHALERELAKRKRRKGPAAVVA